MGCDKLYLSLDPAGGSNFLEASVDLLRPYCSQILLACRPDQAFDPRLDAYCRVYDKTAGAGPIAGICAALAHAQQAVLALSCDMPFMDNATLQKLVQARNARPKTAIMTTYRQYNTQHVQALAAVYEYACLPWLEKSMAEGKYKINEAVPRELRHDIVWHGNAYLPFFNINSPQDLEQARQTAQRRLQTHPHAYLQK